MHESIDTSRLFDESGVLRIPGSPPNPSNASARRVILLVDIVINRDGFHEFPPMTRNSCKLLSWLLAYLLIYWPSVLCIAFARTPWIDNNEYGVGHVIVRAVHEYV